MRTRGVGGRAVLMIVRWVRVMLRRALLVIVSGWREDAADVMEVAAVVVQEAELARRSLAYRT